MLKSVSLMLTSLMTSLHDTTISDLNHGFKEATRHFKKIIDDTKHILEVTDNSTDIRNMLEILTNITEIMDDTMKILTDESITVAGLAIAGVMIFLIVIQTGMIIKLNRDVKFSVLKIQELRKYDRESKQKEQGDKMEK